MKHLTKNALFTFAFLAILTIIACYKTSQKETLLLEQHDKNKVSLNLERDISPYALMASDSVLIRNALDNLVNFNSNIYNFVVEDNQYILFDYGITASSVREEKIYFPIFDLESQEIRSVLYAARPIDSLNWAFGYASDDKLLERHQEIDSISLIFQSLLVNYVIHFDSVLIGGIPCDFTNQAHYLLQRRNIEIPEPDDFSSDRDCSILLIYQTECFDYYSAWQNQWIQIDCNTNLISSQLICDYVFEPDAVNWTVFPGGLGGGYTGGPGGNDNTPNPTLYTESQLVFDENFGASPKGICESSFALTSIQNAVYLGTKDINLKFIHYDLSTNQYIQRNVILSYLTCQVPKVTVTGQNYTEEYIKESVQTAFNAAFTLTGQEFKFNPSLTSGQLQETFKFEFKSAVQAAFSGGTSVTLNAPQAGVAYNPAGFSVLCW